MSLKGMDQSIPQNKFLLENENQFILFPLKEGLWLREEIKVSFSDLKDVMNIPKLNKNGQCFTPFFCLEEQNQLESRQPLQLKVQEAIKQPIYEPKPTKSYCHVCCEKYTDYLKHIAHLHHKKKLSQKIPNLEIQSLVSKLVKTKQQKNKKRQNKNEYTQNPSKKRIIDEKNSIQVKSITNLKENQSTIAETQQYVRLSNFQEYLINTQNI